MKLKYTMKRTAEDDEDDDDTKTDLESEGNNIYFYGDISLESVTKFNHLLKKKEVELLKASVDYGFEPEINVYIHSSGGDLHAGLSAMDHIQNCRVHVNTISDGCVASAASFMLIGGHGRYILPHSTVLIHQIRTGFWGKWEDLKDEHKNCQSIMKQLKSVYLKNTKLGEKKVDELLQREILLTADECVKYGLGEPY